jgi:DNA adenine methylase
MGIASVSVRYYSPLRYPGGKAKIAGFLKLLIEENGLIESVYVEPFAGGASVAIDLLVNEFVSAIQINDIDYAVYAFWKSSLTQSERFCEAILAAPLTIQEWLRQRTIYQSPGSHDIFDVGFAAFYLNRTNHSGILDGGPIGGVSQSGKWGIDARFPRQHLVERVRRIACFRDRICLTNEDAFRLLSKLLRRTSRRCFLYLDPPYYKQGHDLYVNFYTHIDHEGISRLMGNNRERHWLVSYDDAAEIRAMYGAFRQLRYQLSYTARDYREGAEVLVFSDSLAVPPVQNPVSRKEIREVSFDRQLSRSPDTEGR